MCISCLSQQSLCKIFLAPSLLDYAAFFSFTSFRIERKNSVSHFPFFVNLIKQSLVIYRFMLYYVYNGINFKEAALFQTLNIQP